MTNAHHRWSLGELLQMETYHAHVRVQAAWTEWMQATENGLGWEERIKCLYTLTTTTIELRGALNREADFLRGELT